MATVTPHQTDDQAEDQPCPDRETSGRWRRRPTRSSRPRPARRPSRPRGGRRATYRLQLHRGFRSTTSSAVVDYLAELGITDVYLSPYLAARPGSTHGYDVFDHGRINPEVGDEPAHDRLLARLAARGMGRVLDIVPNHMGIGGREPRSGSTCWRTARRRRGAAFFDIDWSPVKDELEGRVLLPILEDLYGKVLEDGHARARARRRDASWSATTTAGCRCAPRSYAHGPRPRAADEFAGAVRRRTTTDVLEYLSIRDAAAAAPGRVGSATPEEVEHVRREKEVIKRRLARLCDRSPALREFVDENVASFRGTPGRPAELRPAARAAGGPGLPARLLAGRGRGDQLPPVLRRQRPGRPPDRGPAGLRARPRA